MIKKSQTKEDYPTLSDLMFKDKPAIKRQKRIKGFRYRKPDKYFKPGFKRK